MSKSQSLNTMLLLSPGKITNPCKVFLQMFEFCSRSPGSLCDKCSCFFFCWFWDFLPFVMPMLCPNVIEKKKSCHIKSGAQPLISPVYNTLTFNHVALSCTFERCSSLDIFIKLLKQCEVCYWAGKIWSLMQLHSRLFLINNRENI